MYGIYLKVSPSGISVVKLTHCGQQHVVEEQGYGHDDEHQAIGSPPADHPGFGGGPGPGSAWILLAVLIRWRRSLSSCVGLRLVGGRRRYRWLLADAHDAAIRLHIAILLIAVQLLLEGIFAGRIAGGSAGNLLLLAVGGGVCVYGEGGGLANLRLLLEGCALRVFSWSTIARIGR